MKCQNRKFLKLLSILILIFILYGGCASEQNYLVNLSFVKEAIINYHESGEYDRDVNKAIEIAKKEFSKIAPAKNSAVVFDVDATALSDYKFNKEWDFGYIPKDYDTWIDSANAPAVPGVLDFYKYLIGRGFKIIFLTGRKDYQYYATMENLIKVGYEKFDTLIVKDKNYYDSLAVKYKSEKRTELTAKGYNIVGAIGDQWSDLEGPYHGIQVKIPDYQYYIE